VNRLGTASSPYLRQHADNPVDWYPWGEEAFARARAEDKPLFISIGYAACHWCHVMAHESFMDPEVAALLAAHFVSVKVDREERPDVDAIYMAAVQAMTGSGGWPMSVFCTPDGRPFFAGTYFPPVDRHGLPSLRRVLGALSEAWSARREEVEAQADALVEAIERETRLLDRLAPVAEGDRPDAGTVARRALSELAERFDPVWGGFDPAPKFPRATHVELCLRAMLRGISVPTGPDARTMATTTLDAMAAGGIYDHLEGGFARYSTDNRWLVPHFEKMLSDQALLLRAYLHAWQVTDRPAYLQVVHETTEFVLDALSTQDGGFCSSLDADAGGVEGGHATWTPAEVREALRAAGTAEPLEGGTEDTDDLEEWCAAVCAWWNVRAEGDLDGRAVLHRPPGAPLARPEMIERARAALRAARRRRPQPARDDKVLTQWHAMFTAALAEAAWVCDEPAWRAHALVAAEHLFTHCRRSDGRWLRSKASGVPAFAGDYAAVVDCTTWLATLTGDARWLAAGEDVADAMLDLFWDEPRGGLCTTGRDAETLIARPKEIVDGALPSANAAAALALLRLSALTGTARWAEAGTRITELALPLAVSQPLALADMLAALAFVDHGAQVVVAGDRPDLVDVVRHRWLPDAVVAWGTPGSGPLWQGRTAGAAYVCHHFVCEQPAYDVEALAAQLDHLAGSSRR
jgi:uncharacterized protein YyaL (SSP411 family)